MNKCAICEQIKPDTKTTFDYDMKNGGKRNYFNICQECADSFEELDIFFDWVVTNNNK